MTPVQYRDFLLSGGVTKVRNKTKRIDDRLGRPSSSKWPTNTSLFSNGPLRGVLDAAEEAFLL